MGSNPAWRIQLRRQLVRGNRSGNKYGVGLELGQTITQRFRVLLHPVFHDFGTMAYGAQMAVDALHHRITAVP